MYTLSKKGAEWEIANGSGLKVVVEKLSDIDRAIFLLDFKSEAKKEGSRRDVVKSILTQEPMTVKQIIEKIGGVKKEEEKFFSSILSILAGKKIIKRKKNADGIFEYTAKK
jgi:hypothetical protein